MTKSVTKSKKVEPASDAVTLDFDSLTIGDLEDFESVADEPLSGFVGAGSQAMSAKALKALVWISRRAEEPGFSLEDAAKVRVSALNWGSDEGEGDESDPS